jgi:hypothetical protein
MTRGRVGLLLACLIGVAACASPSGSAPSDQPGASQPGIAPQLCYEAPPLRGPDGELIDLTGTWQNSADFEGSLVFVSQVGNCVSWAGGFPSSQESAERVGSPWGGTTVTFQGTVGSDFVINGTWAWVRQGPPMQDPLTIESQEWVINFIDNVPAELTFTATDDDGLPNVWTLRKISDEFLEPLSPAS